MTLVDNWIVKAFLGWVESLSHGGFLINREQIVNFLGPELNNLYGKPGEIWLQEARFHPELQEIQGVFKVDQPHYHTARGITEVSGEQLTRCRAHLFYLLGLLLLKTGKYTIPTPDNQLFHDDNSFYWGKETIRYQYAVNTDTYFSFTARLINFRANLKTKTFLCNFEVVNGPIRGKFVVFYGPSGSERQMPDSILSKFYEIWHFVCDLLPRFRLMLLRKIRKYILRKKEQEPSTIPIPITLLQPTN